MEVYVFWVTIWSLKWSLDVFWNYGSFVRWLIPFYVTCKTYLNVFCGFGGYVNHKIDESSHWAFMTTSQNRNLQFGWLSLQHLQSSTQSYRFWCSSTQEIEEVFELSRCFTLLTEMPWLEWNQDQKCFQQWKQW